MPNETPSPEMLARALAEQFHEAYERLAPSFGYETRQASRKPWSDVPERNRNLMTAVCAEMLAAIEQPLQQQIDHEKAEHKKTQGAWDIAHRFQENTIKALQQQIETLEKERDAAVSISNMAVTARIEAQDALRRAEQELAQARALLNPNCDTETLCGAIRNLQQARLSEKGNAEDAEQQIATLRENEGAMLRKLSDALSGGNAGTWDEIVHAAEQIATLETRLALFEKKAAEWNAEADKYLAQRDEFDVALRRAEHEASEWQERANNWCAALRESRARVEQLEQALRNAPMPERESVFKGEDWAEGYADWWQKCASEAALASPAEATPKADEARWDDNGGTVEAPKIHTCPKCGPECSC